jgi:hypothetical protein
MSDLTLEQIEIERKAFENWYIQNYHDGDIHPDKRLLEWSDRGDFYYAISVQELWKSYVAGRASMPSPVGFQLPNSTDLVVLIEQTVESQMEASGLKAVQLHRLDGEKIIFAINEFLSAQEKI